MSNGPAPGSTAFGLRIPLRGDVTELVAIAQRAEQLGYDSVWVVDHLVWPETIDSAYPYRVGGQLPLPSTTPFLDPWTLLAAIAVQTDRIRLGTAVYVLPLRHHLVSARAIATVDALSQGRVIAGVGIGWMREEFDAAGQSFDDRGARTDDIIAAIRRLWAHEIVEYDGPQVSVPPLRFEPKPPQGGSLPIHIGGQTTSALRRAAACGDGWIGMPQTPGDAARRIESLAQMRLESGRATLPFESTVMVPGATSASEVRAFVEAGADRILASPWGDGDWRTELADVSDRWGVGPGEL